MPRYFLLAGVIVLGIYFLASPAKAEVEGCKAARGFVTQVSNRVAAIMSKPTGHKSRFLRLFKQRADLRAMANFALGKYARSMPSKMKAEYYRLAEKMVASLFSAKMGRTRGRRYKIWNCKPKGRGYTVNGAVVEKNGNMVIDVHWLLMPRGRSLKVLDISVAHLWLTQQQRTAFRSVLSKNGGDFSALLKHMRAQAS
ncbi:MAG TPA: ABC transporter substrate-binding protein [Rhizobiales bacterium]|nr:ABC transporter substrate-binding protein [Hyphomicrobiales bacterium]